MLFGYQVLVIYNWNILYYTDQLLAPENPHTSSETVPGLSDHHSPNSWCLNNDALNQVTWNFPISYWGTFVLRWRLDKVHYLTVLKMRVSHGRFLIYYHYMCRTCNTTCAQHVTLIFTLHARHFIKDLNMVSAKNIKPGNFQNDC